MPVLEKTELWKRPGVTARSKEEAKGLPWWPSGKGSTLSLQGVRVWSQNPASCRAQHSQKGKWKRKKKKKNHLENARVCSIFVKTVQPLPNTCLLTILPFCHGNHAWSLIYLQPHSTRESDHNLHICNRAIRPEMDRMETNEGRNKTTYACTCL